MRSVDRKVDGQRAQVAVVDADEPGTGGLRAVELDLVVHLDQGVEPASPALAEQVTQFIVAQCGDDQQDGRGSAVGRLPDLIGIDDEVLAQHRHSHGMGGCTKVVKGAAEARRLSEHRDGVGARRLVGLRTGSGVECGRDRALARRAAFDLGDQRKAAARTARQRGE